MNYESFYNQSISEKEVFWGEQAQKINWFKSPTNILTRHNDTHYSWFEDGELNTCYLAIDSHIEQGRGEQIALIYDSPVTDTKRSYTYNELKTSVAKLAGGLQKLGVVKGDTVVIYMPMIPEAVFAMLACARLGAIHSVVFGGFAPHELAIRIEDAKPKVVISATCGIEVNKIIKYKPYLDEAIELSVHKPQNVVLLQREMAIEPTSTEIDFNELMDSSDEAACVAVKSIDPLYILYTSGTTGKPKGIVRDNGGHAVALRFSMEYIYNAKQGDVYWAASDVGWVVGHSYIVYAPLIMGCTTVFFEGKPVKTPDAGTFWRMIDEHKVNHFFTAPTAFRAIKKEDPHAEELKKYDLSSLKNVFVAGERCDPPTLEWIKEVTGKNVIDHWWQTETGWSIVANMMGVEVFPVKPGSATKPVCGYEIHILDEAGHQLGPNQQGYVCLKLPLPPSCLSTLWEDDERFVSSYLEHFPGYYLTGDGGYIDSEGYVFIMGRVDDVINVAGHRLSTGEMEEIIGSHSAIAECAVIGIEDELRGQIPVGLVVLKDGVSVEHKVMEEEMIQLIRHQIGAVAFFRNALVVKRLPKTRSGKILRKTMRMLIDNQPFTVPSTIDDPAILEEIKEVVLAHKVGNISL